MGDPDTTCDRSPQTGPTINDRPPNFRDHGQLYLIRCYACSNSVRGRENWLIVAALGRCAWCGWTPEAPTTTIVEDA